MDLCGPFQTPIIGYKRKFLAITATLYRYRKRKLLTNRTEVGDYLGEYIAWLERRFKKNVKRSHANSVKGFLSMRKNTAQK